MILHLLVNYWGDIMDYDTDSMSVKEPKLVTLSEDDATVSYSIIKDDIIVHVEPDSLLMWYNGMEFSVAVEDRTLVSNIDNSILINDIGSNMLVDDRDDMDWKIIGKCDRILCVEKVPDFDGFRLWYVYNMTKRESLFCVSDNCSFCRRKTKVDFLKEAIFA